MHRSAFGSRLIGSGLGEFWFGRGDVPVWPVLPLLVVRCAAGAGWSGWSAPTSSPPDSPATSPQYPTRTGAPSPRRT